jgi:hypothetical protein
LANNEIHGSWTVLLSGLLIWMPSPAADASERASLPTFSAAYQVRYGLLRGEMTLELGHSDSGYLYETSLRPTGLVAWFKRGAIAERTTLIEAAGSIRPIDYVSRDTIANPERNTVYLFDYQGGRVTGEYKSQSIEAPIRADGQNRISVQVAIMLTLQSGAEITQYSVFDRGRWKDYRFEVIREQFVKTKSGEFDTVEVRYSSSDKDKSWSIHFAPELSNLPVMLEYHEGDKLKSRAQLTGYTIRESVGLRPN